MSPLFFYVVSIAFSFNRTKKNNMSTSSNGFKPETAEVNYGNLYLIIIIWK